MSTLCCVTMAEDRMARLIRHPLLLPLLLMVVAPAAW
jgi:hypothetical protein